ncbi:MAG: phospholipase [Mycobacterium sp.]|nr:phospholipase [Mycobacterium sp.]
MNKPGTEATRHGKPWTAAAVAVALVASTLSCSSRHAPAPQQPSTTAPPGASASADVPTATPIHHLVVIFQENVSFDHYFGTYPRAANTDGRPFSASATAPPVGGLSPALLVHNPNKAQPMRLGGPTQQVTCDQDHGYTAEQHAFNGGSMDRFVEYTQTDACKPPLFQTQGLVMDYYDGNSVTALWNYAQHFAMSDNSYNTTFGPSTPGALNLISGQTHGVTSKFMPGGKPFPAATVIDDGGAGRGTVIGDPQPLGDDCSSRDQIQLSSDNKNIGDLLNDKNVSWGFFQGGFKPTAVRTDGSAVCGARHDIGTAVGGTGEAGPLPYGTYLDYIPHHEPFQYYASTANPHHRPPSAVGKIGQTDQANHQYDLTDFWDAADNGSLPAVSFLKAPAYQDGHAGYSDPIDEQRFLVATINRLQQLPDWKNTAVVISYDDSDGWYDHRAVPVVSTSTTPADALSGPGRCGEPAGAAPPYQGRCGYGPRLPLLVVSPYARANYVDHTVTDQTSILRFIEDNWAAGRIGDDSLDARAGALTGMLDFVAPPQPPLILDPATGAPH